MCEKNPINKDTVKQTEEETNMTILKELANMQVDASYLRIDNGYSFLFQIVDLNDIEQVETFYQEKPTGVAWNWRVLLKDILVSDLTIVQYKREMNPEKCSKIEGQERNKSYILQLRRRATQKLSKYILDHDIKTNFIIKMWRTGEGNRTTYNFLTEKANPSME
jgi:hypothetical protein